MATKTKAGKTKGNAEGTKDLYLRLPEGLKDRLRALTGRSRRSMNMEAVVALEAWVNQGETSASKKGGKR